MGSFSCSVAWAVSAAALLSGVTPAANGNSSAVGSGVIAANMDRTISPRVDLFRHANGTWLRTVQIPKDRSNYGVQQLIIERTEERRRDLYRAAITSRDADYRKVGALYASFMDERGIDRAGLAPIAAELARIEAIGDTRMLAEVMGRLDRLGVVVPISTYVAPDIRKSDQYALWLSQNDLGLPGRDYYLSPNAVQLDQRAKYRSHIGEMLKLAGDPDADRHADATLHLETEIARLQWVPIDRRDPKKTYNPKVIAELRGLAPGFEWEPYFAGAGMSPAPSVAIARQPNYLAGVAALTRSVPLDTWKAYFRYLLLAATAPYLPQRFSAAHANFHQGVLRGTTAQPDRWKRASNLVDRLLSEASGRLYVEHHFGPRAEAKADEMVTHLFAAYRERIQTIDWMTPATKRQALAKLQAMDVKVGHPKRWRDYDGLVIRADDLVGNVLRAQQWEFDRQHRRIGGKVDRGEWLMSIPTPDAYYSPGTNEIGFPAGILQAPLFDPDIDDAYNYGSTGATIGHEMSHGFDNRGSQYDASGNLRDWWTAADRVQYEARTTKLVRQFERFEPLPGTRIDGKLVLSENIADLAGLSIAWRAYLKTLNGRTPPVIDGLTGAQRFFLAYAQGYLGKRRDESLPAYLKTNTHPPERYRVNGIVVHLPAFYQAFKVRRGDPMYLPPEERASIW